MRTIMTATHVAVEAHTGKVSPHSEEPYIHHLIEVAYLVRSLEFTSLAERAVAEAAAWLHDVVEDTNVPVSELTQALVAEGVPDTIADEVATVVTLLTKTPGEPNKDYYARIKTNELAVVVKAADMAANLAANKFLPDGETKERLFKKYTEGLEYLAS